MTNQLKYDNKVALTIASLRKMRRIKQLTVANALCIDQSVYSRIESCDINITPGQLKIISEVLNISTFQIITIVEHELEVETTPNIKTSLPSLIANYILTFHSYNTINEFKKVDYQKVIEIIQAKIRQIEE
ncbi:MAG: helix-turn-helix transcriptional regulator [Bacteroidia bacterium]|nr:helix-turn-helix transcriptional regulator [Bacteroidia bacterium]